MQISFKNNSTKNNNSLTVEKYNQLIANTINQTPNYWVHGSIIQINIRGKVAYLNIGQFTENNTTPIAVLPVFMWVNEYYHFNEKFSQVVKPFQLTKDLKINVLVKPNFYVPWGKFQPKILDIDSNFTISELIETRSKTIQTLKAEGIFDNNKKQLFRLPLKIGVISSPNSAAYNDFITTLQQSHFKFQIFFYSSKMQGIQTESNVCQAITTLEQLKLDVICIIRGGGSKSDLVYFDSEKIARTILMSSIPILTGIGHQIDESIADLVAYQNRITPTDCASFLIQKMESFKQSVDRAFNKITDQPLQIHQRHFEKLHRTLLQYQATIKNRSTQEFFLQKQMINHIKNYSDYLLNSQQAYHINYIKGLKRGPTKILTQHQFIFTNYITILKSHWRNTLKQAKSKIDFQLKNIAQQHPKELLKKGFALIKSNNNKYLSFQNIKVGQNITIEMQTGSFDSKIISKKGNND